MSDLTISEKLIQFSSSLAFSDIPQEAVTAAKFHVLDTIGVCLAASTDDTSQAVKRALLQMDTKAEQIRLKNGRSFEHRMPANRGAQANPASEEEIIGKFEDNASIVLSRENIQKLKGLLLNIESVPDVREITRCMAV